MRYEPLTIFMVLILGCGVRAWENDYDDPLNFNCPGRRQTIKTILSEHSSRREDRRFYFTCENVGYWSSRWRSPYESCDWDSNYVNDYDKELDYKCQSDGYIAGMRSIHSNRREDRIWKFKCCHLSGYRLEECHTSSFVNDFDGKIDYTLPPGTVLRGVYAIHDNHHEDRRFEFRYCKLKEGTAKRSTGIQD